MDLADTNRVKRAMEWFKRTVFQDEAVQPRRQEGKSRCLPPSAPPGLWQRVPLPLPGSQESLFVMQAKVLANYEDDYVYDEPVLHYYPTYQSLTDPELRGILFLADEATQEMFKKRLCLRISLHLQLLNQIGVTDLWTATRN